MRRIAKRFLIVTLIEIPIFCILTGVVLCEGTLRPRHQWVPDSPAEIIGEGFPWHAATITATDGATLKAWFLEPPHPTHACTMVLHGIGDSRSGSIGFAPMFLRRGDSVLVPDIRAHGQSGGKITTFGLLEARDTALWIAWLRAHDCAKVYGLGESLGAAIALQTAGFDAIAAPSDSPSP